MDILIPILVLGSLGLLFGAGLAIASKLLVTKNDSRIEAIHGLLPGSNCGACGGAGCFGFAESILSGKLPLEACKVSSEQAKGKIAAILGIKFEAKSKTAAVVHCNGGTNRVKDKFIYEGITDCNLANLTLGGPKECTWGCIGFGTCAKACTFGAITMSEENLPIVNHDKCTACGKCVKSCPKKLFSLVPLSENIYVSCNSHDAGDATIKVCPVGCIACGICTQIKDSPFYIEENLSYVDYKKPNAQAMEEARNKCPTKCILKKYE